MHRPTECTWGGWSCVDVCMGRGGEEEGGGVISTSINARDFQQRSKIKSGEKLYLCLLQCKHTVYYCSDVVVMLVFISSIHS